MRPTVGGRVSRKCRWPLLRSNQTAELAKRPPPREEVSTGASRPAHPSTQWRLTLTAPDGRPLAHGCARTRPPPRPRTGSPDGPGTRARPQPWTFTLTPPHSRGSAPPRRNPPPPPSHSPAPPPPR